MNNFSCVFLILVHNIFSYFPIQSLRTGGIATVEKCESKMIRKTSLSGGKLVFLGDDLLFVEYTGAKIPQKVCTVQNGLDWLWNEST